MKNYKFILLAIFGFWLAACTYYYPTEIQRRAPVFSSQQNKTTEAHHPNKNTGDTSRNDQVVSTYPYQSPPVNKKTDFFEREKPLSPAVVALLSKADQNYKSGEYDQAVATLERALRIEPRNAKLVYKLAAVRLKQNQPRLAENLAKKAALLAGNNTMIKRRAWLLIAEARRRQGNQFGAKEARQKAAKY